MIYKTTYQLSVCILLVGMGLMYWKNSVQNQEHKAIQQTLIKSMERHDKILEDNLFLQESTLWKPTKERKEKKVLLEFAERTNQVIEVFTKLIDVQLDELQRTNYSNLNCSLIDIQHKKTVSNIESILEELKLQSRFGITLEEIQFLKEELNIRFLEPKCGDSFTAKDSLVHKVDLIKRKRTAMESGLKVIGYLDSKILIPCRSNLIATIFSFPDKQIYTEGEQFRTRLFQSERILQCFNLLAVYVNDKSVPIFDNKRFIDYQWSVPRKGRIPYHVKMILEHSVTKEKSTIQKTFSYLVI